jgi:uncharacterized protein YkwD
MMRSIYVSWVFAAAMAVVVPSCRSVPSVAISVTPVSASPSSAPAARHTTTVFGEVNAYRAKHGARPLLRHSGLDRLAQSHCEYLREKRGTFGIYGKNVSHVGFEGRALAARHLYGIGTMGENVAATNSHAPELGVKLVQMWATSRAHEHNMRNSWTHTGIGVVVDSDGMVFATQLFATMGGSQLSGADRFGHF